MTAQFWMVLAWSFLAVKLVSTTMGLRLKQSGTLFSSRIGWVLYALSKIFPAIFCFALYKNAALSNDALNAKTYGWLAIFAVIFALIVVAQTLRRLVSTEA